LLFVFAACGCKQGVFVFDTRLVWSLWGFASGLAVLALQGHLISNQLFVFVKFLFLWLGQKWYVEKNVSCETGFKKSFNFLQLLSLFERLMCEVEFWEVFTKGAKVFKSGAFHATC
jgi:hypothetical protein